MRGAVASDMRCAVEGCGQEHGGIAGGRELGWVVVRVIGSGDPARRYCSGSCASKGIAHVELGNHRPASRPVQLSRSRPNNSREITVRLRELGLSNNQLRGWAHANGHSVGARGAVPTRIVELYLAAHPSAVGE